MKRPPADMTVERLAGLLCGKRQFSDDLGRAILGRWYRDAADTGDSGNVARFARWLIALGYLTESQVDQLLQSPQVEPPDAVSPVMKAVMVAPAALPRPERAAVAKAAPDRPESMPPAPESPAPESAIDVELVDAPTVRLAAPASDAAPGAELLDAELVVPPADIPVQLAAPPGKPLPQEPTPAAPNAPVSSPIDWTNVWLFLFLGALGLLFVQFLGWALAHLVALVF
jgi:hypothetical protein